MTFIKYVLACEICKGAVAWNGGIDLYHLEMTSRGTEHLAATARRIEKDHEPFIESINGHVIIQEGE